MSLKQIILDTIREKGLLTVAEYMQLALAHPQYGYYMRGDPFGEKGDFITAPEISQIFGELIGAWLATLWQQQGGGDVALVELGPGRGTLMKDILRATAGVPDFHESLCVVLVETSPALTRLQRAALAESHSRVAWQKDLRELPELPALFVANEFFDALPIRQFVRTAEGLKEKLVDIAPEGGEHLCFVVQELGIRLIKGGAYSGDEMVVESCPAARGVVHDIAVHLRRFGGGGLIVDYGYTGGSRGNTLQAVKKHGFHPVLECPGMADITAHVDFDALRECFSGHGVATFGTVEQGTFLTRIGAELRAEALLRNASPAQREDIFTGLRRLIAPTEMGELFKVLGFISDARVTPAGFAEEEERL
jgi:NADH dehydrogenase [ubiquinone] 1 alpha subcomplex assembly factor 7